jgi:ComF family protein
MRLIKKFVWLLIDFVIPPRCLNCHTMIIAPGHLCAACWGKLAFISHPFCDQCAFPFDYDIDDEMRCGACITAPPLYRKARAALIYDDASKPLILKFKHGDGTYLTPAFTDLMLPAGAELIESADYLMPVPLHWQRLIRRRYNQAALLTQGLANKTKKPALLNALKRTRNTPSQGHLTHKERSQNVKNAFTLKSKYKRLLQGKHVILIDDVMTSGSTLHACAKALLKQGVATVDVLTLARVASPKRFDDLNPSQSLKTN